VRTLILVLTGWVRPLESVLEDDQDRRVVVRQRCGVGELDECWDAAWLAEVIGLSRRWASSSTTSLDR